MAFGGNAGLDVGQHEDSAAGSRPPWGPGTPYNSRDEWEDAQKSHSGEVLDPSTTTVSGPAVPVDDDYDRTTENGIWSRIGPALGYEYLGPGTDLQYRRKHNVKPKDDLDKAAMEHDYEYERIGDAYEEGDITYEQACDAIDRADWKLANDSFVITGKALPGFAYSVGKEDYVSAFMKAAKTAPASLTSSAMRIKWVLSKLGIARGSFSRIKKGRGPREPKKGRGVRYKQRAASGLEARNNRIIKSGYSKPGQGFVWVRPRNQ